MLEDAGILFEYIGAGVDEDAAKASMVARGISVRGLADALAELKAVKISQRYPDALVLGCDQVMSMDGAIFDKPKSREEAFEQLGALSGKRHQQTSAAVICEAGKPVWRHIDVARLTMRHFSRPFLESYLDAEWPEIGHCAGGYRIEGHGVQLFERIDGSHFTVLGLPLLPLLDYLRARGLLPK